MFLSEKDQEFIYNAYINELKKSDNFINGENNLVNKMHKLGLLRKVKSRKTNKIRFMLTEEGFVLAVIMCRLRGDFHNNRSILEVFWW